MTNPIAYGIDFGTTNSAVAVASPNRVEILDIAASPFPELLKSVLYLNRDRQELAGQEAIAQYSYTATAETQCSNCRLAHFSRTGIVSTCKWAAHGGGCADSRIVFGVKQFLAQRHIDSTHSWGRDFTLGYLSAVVIRRLKSLADAQLNQRVDRVVIGHPVRFAGEQTLADHQRGVAGLTDAAKGAVFSEVELMDEPVAAHMATRHSSGPLITLDFGGGTFDVAVIDGASNQVLAKRGLAVGGEEFDALLFDAKLARRFGLDEPGVPSHIGQSIRSLSESCFLLGNPRSLTELVDLAPKVNGLSDLLAIISGGHLVALHQAVEKAKIDLSTRQLTEILLERRGISIEVTVARSDFESMIAPSLKDVLDEIRLALEEAGVKAVDVTGVTLTGGSSQIPAFGTLVNNLFGTGRIQEAAVFGTVVKGLAERGRVRWGTVPAGELKVSAKIEPKPEVKSARAARSTVPEKIEAPRYVYSEDGRWRWDGRQWQSRYSTDGKQYWTEGSWRPAHSPDLSWWWSGTKWEAARSGQWWWNGRAWGEGKGIGS